MSDLAMQALERLGQLWRRERDAARAAHRREREQLDFGARVARGLALAGLTLDDTDATAGGRVLLWWKVDPKVVLAETRIGTGDPVLLWAGEPTGERTASGVIARIQGQRIAVAVESDYPEFLEQMSVNLDREAPEVTFTRGEQALARFAAAERGSDLERLREVLLGERAPEARTPPELTFFDRALDPTQRAAVTAALAAQDIALIHGPPGTGKTRTLVELVRQAVARGERVLVTAPSNTAVDNVGERLIEAGVPLVRLGHPARVSRALEARTLDALVDASDARERARRWIIEANAIRRRVDKQRARSRLPWAAAREQLREARDLMRDAHKALDAEREVQLARCPVVCATAAGVEVSALAGQSFDRVVLDEATQAVDPIALAAIGRGARAVLAGDPQQLPPTLIDADAAAEGLGSTLFERLAARAGERVLRMLQVQYRMHAALMRFPSDSMYGGQLRADASVAERRLDPARVREDPLRPGPLHFIDGSGKGWSERREGDDPSTSNPGQAERTAREVLRLLSRGLPADQLAVITPYLAQARRLRETLRSAVGAGLEIGTVDGFQGREKEVVIVDLVRSNDDGQVGFLADTRRMNVAITRARSLLLVIGDSATLQHHPYYRRFMDAAEASSAYLSAWSDDAEAME